ncbi:MAG: phosphatase PAP2 family protein [Thermus sp.]|uniref:phosphatase PAP2 family protein n=1 Tax=Thermus sp. TaxID=275 RepID=UPI00351B3BA2
MKLLRRPWLLLGGFYGLLVGSLALFVELAEDVYRKEGFAFDGAILAGFHRHQSPLGDALALALTQTASPPAVILGVLALLLWAYRRRRPWPILLIFLGGSEALNLLAKVFFARSRPHLFPQLTPESDYSFPSGHTMASLALVLALYWALEDRPALAAPALLLGLAWALMVASSRLYLQVHYPSDVLAGWALTTAWFLGLRLVWRGQGAGPSGGR